ncbi:uncharacterized protein FMAN_15397 [Fusarium mangiferae]|uniref:Azaphilone pigments biosynthesis cluster protein L N-terminal domain-containing protein n=1 Tax=Fusarium mangiferae TaxID=192010 RepID=A0A1L7UG48_FUSMA|nr:uncharacterized protein FMAN_15397 [Fusarium mangiferae]CVL07333.1 uncharacterized protein FMAN_15397 [Fusarium mangiferae]
MPFSKILGLQADRWNNPEDSIGPFVGYLHDGRYRCWEATGPARQAFRQLSPDVKDCLETSSIPPADIVSWSIYMVGHNEHTAAPKLLICSTDLKTRKYIRKLIKDSKIMDKHPGIGLGDVSALPDRHVIRELSREAIEALLPLGCDIDGTVLADGSEPAVGKRIFVVNPNDFSLRPATTGPIILQDGKCYQLTVAHAFRHTREPDHLSSQQIAEEDCDFDGMSDVERDDEVQYDETTSRGSVTPGKTDSDKASFVASLDTFSGGKHLSSRSESPSSDHLSSVHDSLLSVESTEDSLKFGELDVSQLQFFGRLIFSSLAGTSPSLDYALIETSRTVENLEKSSWITGSLVSAIGEIGLDDISIVATTSPHCLVEGQLTATPSYIRLPGQLTFQRVYPVRLGKPLHDGDCGTAVFGKFDDRLYGHVVAGGPGTSIAYLVPAGEISRDIQARLGFDLVWMPQQDEQPMAEVVDLGSGLTLATSARQSIAKVQEAVQSFRCLPRQVRELLSELAELSTILQELSQALGSDVEVDLSALKATLEQCTRSCEEFERELRACNSRSSQDRASLREWAKLTYRGGDGIEGFRQQLIGYKSTIVVVLGFANLRTSTITVEAIRSCRGLIETTTIDLEAHLAEVKQKLDALAYRALSNPESDEATTQYIENERLSTEKGLQLCLELSQHIDQIQLQYTVGEGHTPSLLGPHPTSKRLVSEGLGGCDDTIQFMVSTDGKPLNGKNHGVGSRLKQAGGHFKEQSPQQISQDFTTISLHQTGGNKPARRTPSPAANSEATMLHG